MNKLGQKLRAQILAPWLIYIEYAVLSLLIMAPLLAPGFILTMDLVFVPHLEFPQEVTNTYILQVLLWLLNFIVPADVIEKLLLFTILIGSGVGMHKLVVSLKLSRFSPEYVKWGAYFAGIFYMVNPFVYSRFMAGQWMVLLGYALLPFFVRALFRLIAVPSRQNMMRLAAWMFVVVSVSLHHSGIMAIVLAALVVSSLLLRQPRKYIGYVAMSVGLAIVASGYWLLPSLLGGSISSSLGQFNDTHFAAFKSAGFGPLGPVAEVVRLQGFWAEPLQLFVLPKEIVPGWGLLVVGLWVLIGFGVVKAWQEQRFLALGVGLGALVAIVFAATPLLQWLSTWLLLVAGYREPHKFVNVLALAFALFGGVGVMAVLSRVKKRWGEYALVGAMAMLLLLPIAITPTMVWGFRGQLSPRQYPQDWHAMNSYLKDHAGRKSTLFLPWHQYMSFGFSGRIIANPAESFFQASVIASDDPEFRNISPTVPNSQKQRITKVLKERTPNKLANLGISYILLAKVDDYKRYGYIFQQPDVVLIKDLKTLSLYEIRSK